VQPLSVLTGILFGSAAAIAFGLAVSVIVSLAVSGESPQLAAELGALWIHTLVFIALTGVCGLGFYGLVKQARWRWFAQGAMWLALAAVTRFYWPA